MTLTFTPTTPTVATNSNAFAVSVTLPASDQIDTNTNLPPLTDPNLVTPQPVVIEFDQNGDLDIVTSPTTISIDMAANDVAYKNAAGSLLVTWNLLDSLGQPRLTSVASPSAVTDIFQDGSASSELISIQIADSGKLNGIYSDGRTLLLAQLALARFTNPQALQAVGNNNYVPTTSAGLPITGTANTAGLGSVVGRSLEASNVDIAQEFTNLLTYQRGFQANSRVITTADELNQEALNLKR